MKCVQRYIHIEPPELKMIFDDRRYFRNLVKSKQSSASSGLFGMTNLSAPDDFLNSAGKTVYQCEKLVDMIKNAKEDQDLRRIVKRMDMISDSICLIVDTAELIRNVHPDKRWIHACEQTYMILGRFINELNTNRTLFSALDYLIYRRSEIFSKMSDHEQMAALLFHSDFLKFGVHLSKSTRDKIVEINDRINSTGYNYARIADSSIPVPRQKKVLISNISRLDGLPDDIKDKIYGKSINGVASISIDQDLAHVILQSGKDHELRTVAASVLSGGDTSKDSSLLELLSLRNEFSKIIGYENYSSFFLKDKMAGSPALVNSFLEKQNATNLPKAKMFYEQTGKSSDIRMNESALMDYFTVGSVVNGISDMFNQLFGVRFEPADIKHGEVWDDEVRKLKVVHEDLGKIGTIYCDLFERSGCPKFSQAAQFTVRCSRRIDNDEAGIFQQNHYRDLESNDEVFLDRNCGKYYQLPIVALVCGFKNHDSSKPTNLTFNEVETLFHEFGHAIHSMIARTDFQHISGTRCKLDFVEFPSILMEYLLRDPSIIPLYTSHYETGASADTQSVQRLIKQKDNRSVINYQNQLLLSKIDQLYHGASENELSANGLLSIARSAEKSYSVSGSNKASFNRHFSHLFVYGSGYYSYLWSREIAKLVYQQALVGCSPSQFRKKGENLARLILSHGGGKDPRNMNWESLTNGIALEDYMYKLRS